MVPKYHIAFITLPIHQLSAPPRLMTAVATRRGLGGARPLVDGTRRTNRRRSAPAASQRRSTLRAALALLLCALLVAAAPAARAQAAVMDDAEVLDVEDVIDAGDVEGEPAGGAADAGLTVEAETPAANAGSTGGAAAPASTSDAAPSAGAGASAGAGSGETGGSAVGPAAEAGTEADATPLTEFSELPTHHRGRKLSVPEAEIVQERTQYLAIMGKRFPLDLTGGELTIHEAPVFIEEQANTGEGTGLTVWDGSVVLAKYMERAYTHQLIGKNVLELGAGTGLLGIVASVLGARKVIITDLEYTLDNARANVERNRLTIKGEVEVMALDWYKPVPDVGKLDYIIASDVVWVQELIEPLVKTMVGLTNRPDGAGDDWEAPLIVICHQTRSRASDEALFSALGEHFDVSEVPYDDHHRLYRDDQVFIYELRRE